MRPFIYAIEIMCSWFFFNFFAFFFASSFIHANESIYLWVGGATLRTVQWLPRCCEPAVQPITTTEPPSSFFIAVRNFKIGSYYTTLTWCSLNSAHNVCRHHSGRRHGHGSGCQRPKTGASTGCSCSGKSTLKLCYVTLRANCRIIYLFQTQSAVKKLKEILDQQKEFVRIKST